MCFITADRHVLSHTGQSDVTWCPSSPLFSVFQPADGVAAGSRLGCLRALRPAAPLIPDLRVVTRRCHRDVISADSPQSQEAAPLGPAANPHPPQPLSESCLPLSPPLSRPAPLTTSHPRLGPHQTPELRFELKTHQICSCSDDRQKLTNNVSSLCSRTRD